MGKFDGYLICSDFDGTLAEKGIVSKENWDAIAYFQREGGVFSLCSGRRAAFIHDIAEFYRPNGPVIMLNGSLIVAPGETEAEDEILYREMIPEALAKRFAEEILNCPGVKCVTMHKPDHSNSIFPEGAEIPEWAQKTRIGLDDICGAYCKIAVTHDRVHIKETRAAIEPQFRDKFLFTTSSDALYECQMLGSGKGDSALRVKRMIGAHTLVCIGDYENDFTMLRVADISYAVGNAIDEAKRIAHRVTVPCTEHAIAHMIAELEAEL